MADDAGIQNRPSPTGFSFLSVRALLVALVFGLAALTVVVAGLTIPIPGTGVVTDPREIFASTGAALTGPLGGLLIGVLAGIREPGGLVYAGLLAHVAGGLWMGLAYKNLVYRRLDMPGICGGWIVLVLSYYYLIVIPGFVVGQSLFYSQGFIESYGAGTSLVRAYAILGRGALPEALMTTLVTTLVFIALPRRLRTPLW